MSKFTINILDPSSPVEPDTPVPDTGFYTNTSNTNGSISILAPAIVLVVVLMLLTPVFIKLIKRHSKKNNGYTNINTNTDSISINNRANLKRALLIITPVAALALIIPAIVFTISNNTNDENNVKTNNIETTELTELEKLTSERDLSITVSANDVNLDVTLDSDSSNSNNGAKTGVYAVGESTIIINTPTATGLDLYASVESTDLYLNGNKHDIAHKISAVSDNIQYEEFLSPNTWGISADPSVVDDPTTQSWLGFSSEPAEIYETYSATEADHKVGTLYFGTYITPNLVNKETKEGYGTYSGVTINYAAIAHPISYNINYLKNTTDSVIDMPSNVSDSTYDETITLSSNVPKRTGYNFKGWCDGTINTDITTRTDTCDGTIYNPNGSGTNLTYIIDQTISPNRLNLSAMWQEIPYTYSITYNKNTEDEVANMPENVAETTTYDNPITLSSTEPTRDNYKFMGWCTAPVSDGESCDSPNTKYLPGANYNLTRSDANNIILYAIWGKTIYNEVILEWQAGGSRMQTNDEDPDTGIGAVITKENSGVFQYNSAAFGDDTDATKPDGTKDNIYYFRGILDNDLDDTENTYGSNGDGKLWPNYVRLGDTCWRIVRTTASGGVKMIYNGPYSSGTTANSCANATTNAQITTSPFNNSSATVFDKSYTGLYFNNIHAVGYTYSSLPAGTNAYTAISIIFGANGDDTTTNTNPSIIKQVVEDWYSANLLSYTDILEPNAGYCNDRTLYSNRSSTTPLIDSDVIVPGPTGSMRPAAYYFGAYIRNNHPVTVTVKAPSLNCPRGAVDLYTYKTSNGTDLNGGNGQLTKPIALITADESALAGSGNGSRTAGSTYSSNYSYGSYLRSGSDFWLLSPGKRDDYGLTSDSILSSNGVVSCGGSSSYLVGRYGVRPAISLTSGTIISSGTGTAVDPWVIQPNNNQAPEATEPLGVMEKNNNSWQTLKIVLLVLSIVSMTFYILVLIQKIKNHNKEVEE